MQNYLRDLRVEIFQYYDSLVAYTPKLLVAFMLLFLAWIVSRQVRRISDRKLKKEMEDPFLVRFLTNMIRSVIFITGLLFSLKILGLGGVTASILAGAGITAFIIGFALRDIGENFLAGIIMAFKRPFKVGDIVESGPIRGRVIMLNIRDTQLKTIDGKDVFIPNANIIKNPLINFTIDGYLRYDFVVGLPSGSDYKKAMQIIEEAVNNTEGIIKKRRKTSVNTSGISPGRLDVTVSFWIDTFKVKEPSEKILSNVILAVQEALEQNQ
jgi:small conductance mechanosensitive channel